MLRLITVTALLAGCQKAEKPVEPPFENKIKLSNTERPLNSPFLKTILPRSIAYGHTAIGDGFLLVSSRVDTTFFVKGFDSASLAARKVYALTARRGNYITHWRDSLYIYNTDSNTLQCGPSRFENLPSLKTLPQFYSKTGGYYPLYNYQGQPKLMYNYAPWKEKSVNFLDTTAFLIQTGPGSFMKAGRYPNDLRYKRTRYTMTTWDIDGAMNIYFAHEGEDKVYKMDTGFKVVAACELDKYPKRERFIDKGGDLAYIRKYEQLNDRTCWTAVWNNKYIIVMKEPGTEKVLDKKQFRFFVFDTSLNKLYRETVPYDVLQTVFLTETGFLLFTKTLDKYITYDF